jgi:hypothetical protein
VTQAATAGALRTQARFPEVPLDAGHYESFYLRACHPSERLGAWIRYTVHKRPDAGAQGSLWFTLFDASADGPLASKVTTDELGSGPDHYIRVGESRLEPGRVAGSGATDQLDASWELEFEEDGPAFFHLPRDWMYRARLPRTKLLSPYPDTRFTGTIRAGGRSVELDGWPGMVGHNWGAQHAERWIWMHGVRFQGHDDAWLDVALGRIKLGPVTTPWIANGNLHLDGVDHRLGGPGRVRSTEVDEGPDRCRFALAGKGIRVRGEVGSERKNFVGWIYADPDGPEHNTLNCSISDMTLEVERDGAEPLTLHTEGGAAYELGMRETDHGIPIQPFPDG